MNTLYAIFFAGLLALLIVMPAHAQTVSAVLGGQVECDPTNTGCLNFPTNVSSLCDGSGSNLDCPQYFSPDWTDTTGQRFFGITGRTNPPRCLRSVNEGVTWSACAVQPFLAAITLSNSGMSVASDGSLIFAATQLPNTCIIRRSIDQGASWSTVFTDTTASQVCQFGISEPTPNGVHCARADNYCSVAGLTQSTLTTRMYYSTDNGATWTKGVGFTQITGDANNSFAIKDDGSGGSWSMFGLTYATANWGFAWPNGNDWILTTSTIPSQPPGTSLRCPANFIFNGNQAVLCGPDNGAGNTTKYRFWTHAAGSIALAASPIPVNGLTNAQFPDFSAVGFNSTTGYMIGRNAAVTQIQINATRDSFTSLPMLTTITPTTALLAGCCRGDAVLWNNKIYFTIGSAGSNAFFGRIQ